MCCTGPKNVAGLAIRRVRVGDTSSRRQWKCKQICSKAQKTLFLKFVARKKATPL